MLQIELVRNATKWRSILEWFPWFDYVHTCDFHLLSKSLGEGDPVLFVAYDGKSGLPIMCWPSLERPISGSNWYDLSSVYGYGGPLIRDLEQAEQAFREIRTVWHDLGYISVFSRMHPLLNIDEDDFGGKLTKVSDVAVIDVSQTDDVLGLYAKGHRRDIRKLTKMGVEVFVDKDLQFLDKFIEIYYQAMNALQAREYFYYSRNFFYTLFDATDFEALLTLIKLDGEIISGCIDLVGEKVMHAYLGATRAEYRKLASAKMEYWSAHKRAIEQKIDHVVLGVGRPGPDDSLLKFKMDFGATCYPLYIFRDILHEDRYERLCQEKQFNSNVWVNDFFPKYRA